MAQQTSIQDAIRLAFEYQRAGRLAEAEAIYRQVLSQEPNSFPAQFNLGLVLQNKRDLPSAIAVFRRALDLEPNFAEGHASLALAHWSAGQISEAMASFHKSLSLQPNAPHVHNNLGTLLLEEGQVDRAIAEFQTALQLKPDFVDSLNNLGNAFKVARQIDRAIETYSRAIAVDPNCAEAHLNLGQALLLRGDYRNAWPELEWRSRLRGALGSQPQFNRPRWDGRPLNGKRILLYTEQGFGDSIQFARFTRPVAEAGGRIILACPPELARLFATLENVEQLICSADRLPDFDVYSPLLSLPGIFRTEVSTIPAAIPYLRADPDLVGQWNNRLTDHDSSLKVGLVWSGNTANRASRNRFANLEHFGPLAQFSNITLVSLQRQAEKLPSGIIDWTNELNDFADTAALIENLDLVISVDSAVAHLAGAMGKKLWVVLPFSPDWRWMLDRDDSPWYPAARLFRQNQPNDWHDVITHLSQQLLAETKNSVNKNL